MRKIPPPRKVMETGDKGCFNLNVMGDYCRFIFYNGRPAPAYKFKNKRLK